MTYLEKYNEWFPDVRLGEYAKAGARTFARYLDEERHHKCGVSCNVTTACPATFPPKPEKCECHEKYFAHRNGLCGEDAPCRSVRYGQAHNFEEGGIGELDFSGGWDMHAMLNKLNAAIRAINQMNK